ncbi:MAG: hypothetical protein NVS3B21_29770 [Acidimicrobiales bacterium]
MSDVGPERVSGHSKGLVALSWMGNPLRDVVAYSMAPSFRRSLAERRRIPLAQKAIISPG